MKKKINLVYYISLRLRQQACPWWGKANKMEKVDMTKAIGLAVCLVAVFSLPADTTEYGVLPAADASGTIALTKNVKVESDADVSALAAAKSLEIPEDVTLLYASGKPLALSASVSGAGVFKATSAGTVTISADNSGLVAPGHFSFESTPVVVTDEHGLGGAESGAAEFIGDLPKGNLSFSGASSVFTNYAPIAIQKQGGAGNFYFGSGAADRYLVQAASFSAMASAEAHLYFTHNVEFIAGKLTAGAHPRFYQDGAGDVRIGDAVDMELGPNGQAIVYFNNLHLGCRSLLAKNGLSPDASRNIIFERENCLSAETPLRPYGNAMDNTFFNLNGYSQTIACLRQLNIRSNNGSILASAEPVTLTAAGTATGAETVQFEFRGPISYHHNTPWQTTFSRYRLKSTGALTVSAGTVAFANDSGWDGDAVTVKSGGTLSCDSEASLNSGRHVLSVEAGGTLHVADGVTLKLKSATFGSVSLEPATVYTLDEVRALLVSADGITLTGSGCIQTGAASIAGEWTGWPKAGTATTATMPDGTVAEITDENVDDVMALTEIKAGEGVKIVSHTSGRVLDLKASVSGGASFVFHDAGTVVLSGDNSGLISPGGFAFSNTTVVVSNRFGLGGARTAAATFCPAAPCAKNFSTLFFGGDAVTNNAPLSFDYGFRMGHLDPDVRFVQNAEVTQDHGSAIDHQYAGITNDFTIASNCTISVNTLRLLNGAAIRIPVGATLYNGNANLGSGFYYIDGKVTGGLAIEQCLTRFVFGRSETLEVTECRFYDGSNKSFFFDLNGYDQTLPRVIGNQYTNKYQQCFDVVSETPATLTLNGAADRDSGAAIRCLGAASLTYSGASTQTVGLAVSTTTGSLTVNSGAIALEHGAQWLGTNVFVNGGSLIVRPTASADTFGPASSTMTVLHMNDSGILELQSSSSTSAVRSAVIDGIEIDSGTYSSKNCGWIAGDGAIRVLRGPRRSLRIIIR